MSYNRKASKQTEPKPVVIVHPEQQYSNLSEEKKARIIDRILSGRALNMSTIECESLGLDIARTNNHSSFKNYPGLMNDREFILRIAKQTPNPLECVDYFYQYINQYILNSANFQKDFLQQLYRNENIYKLADYKAIAQLIGAEQQNEKLLRDPKILQLIQARLQVLKEQGYKLPYHCSGSDKKELRGYKARQNDMKIAWENKVKGLKEIAEYMYELQNPKKDDLDWR